MKDLKLLVYYLLWVPLIVYIPIWLVLVFTCWILDICGFETWPEYLFDWAGIPIWYHDKLNP